MYLHEAGDKLLHLSVNQLFLFKILIVELT